MLQNCCSGQQGVGIEHNCGPEHPAELHEYGVRSFAWQVVGNLGNSWRSTASPSRACSWTWTRVRLWVTARTCPPSRTARGRLWGATPTGKSPCPVILRSVQGEQPIAVMKSVWSSTTAWTMGKPTRSCSALAQTIMYPLAARFNKERAFRLYHTIPNHLDDRQEFTWWWRRDHVMHLRWLTGATITHGKESPSE